MADALFEDPRLASLYDSLEAWRADLDAYVGLARERRARSVLDIGCGTGTLACALAADGTRVTGLDPAGASLEVARAKDAAHRVRWVHGDVTALPPLEVDLVTMTGNVAQVFLSDADWSTALTASYGALAPRGLLVFETRDPAARAWLGWRRADTWRRLEVAGIGPVETWTEVTDAAPPFVSFRTTVVFEADGTTLTSHSTLRFRERAEITGALTRHGFIVDEVRDAPDRPGLELVFLARRPLGPVREVPG